MDFLKADALPWLAVEQRRMRAARGAQRLPHSSLFLSPPGLGAEHFANWTAALALCDGPPPGARATGDERPCGACASCALLRADTHPDFHVVRLEDDAKQIKVDQIRALIDTLTLKSYRGGYKVAVIEGAEALNPNSANAFLKTLEEPSANTMLILIASPTHRLPATIASRCMRIKLRAPAAALAVKWLQANGRADHRWEASLALAGGSPLLALELDAAGIGELDREMVEGVRAAGAGAVDVTLLAEQWARSNLQLRLAWLETWITRRVHTCWEAAAVTQSGEPVRLPGALLKPKIRALFELLDAARELRRAASTGINQQLALEALLLEGRTALGA